MFFYHSSRKANFKPGDIITPNGGVLFLTSNKSRPHPTLFLMPKGKNVGETRYTIYKVKPTSMVREGPWGDFITFSPAIVVKKIGTAPIKKGRYDYKRIYKKTYMSRKPASVDLRKNKRLMSNRKRKRKKVKHYG
jgi:hypothetical protein